MFSGDMQEFLGFGSARTVCIFSSQGWNASLTKMTRHGQKVEVKIFAKTGDMENDLDLQSNLNWQAH